MIAWIISLFKIVKVSNFAKGLTLLAPMLQHLEDNYIADKDAKNAIIDTWIQILQQHKNITPPQS